MSDNKETKQAPAGTLNRDAIQQKALDCGLQYWRASDAHGVIATSAQAVDLLQDLLGVEVEIKEQAPAVEAGAWHRESLSRSWYFCPECGSTAIHHQEGSHKQCANCFQEWFEDIDYMEVVRGHLAGRYGDKDSEIAKLRAALVRASEPMASERAALANLLQFAERQICTHEETHRGGAIWEICDMCGAKWADDEGGKPKFEWPPEIEAARAALARASEAGARDERAAFEAWLPSIDSRPNFSRHVVDGYDDWDVERVWAGWQARAALARASEAAAEGALIERLKLMLSGDAAFCKTSVARAALEQAIVALSREPAAAAEPIYQVHFSHGWMDVDAMDYDGLSGDKRIVYAAPQPASEQQGDDFIGILTVKRFRGADSMVNTDFEYLGSLPDGSYRCYLHPAEQQAASVAPSKRERLIKKVLKLLNEHGFVDPRDGYARVRGRGFAKNLVDTLAAKGDGHADK